MLELGGNIYFTAKLGATDGHSFRHLAAVMTGSTQEDYAAMMLGGGRSVEGNRSSRAGTTSRRSRPRSQGQEGRGKGSQEIQALKEAEVTSWRRSSQD